MKPPSEVEKPHTPAKPANPMVVEQLGLIAYVVDVAAAADAATALGGSLEPSTPELAINHVARVGVAGEKPSRVDVECLRSFWPASMGRPWLFDI